MPPAETCHRLRQPVTSSDPLNDRRDHGLKPLQLVGYMVATVHEAHRVNHEDILLKLSIPPRIYEVAVGTDTFKSGWEPMSLNRASFLLGGDTGAEVGAQH